MIVLDKYNLVQKGYVVAEIDVTIRPWDLKIRKIKECKKGATRWFNFPSFCEEDEDKKIFQPYMAFKTKEKNEKFFSIVREEVDKFIKKNICALEEQSNITQEVGEC